MTYLTKIKLLKRLAEEGLTATYENFIIKYEKTGQLKCRRNPLSDHRIFNEKDIEEIIAVVKKDGKNFRWHFDQG